LIKKIITTYFLFFRNIGEQAEDIHQLLDGFIGERKIIFVNTYNDLSFRQLKNNANRKQQHRIIKKIKKKKNI
jgi:hypothetical protein